MDHLQGKSILPGVKMTTAQAITFFRPDLYIAGGRQDELDWLLAQQIED